MSPRPGVGRPQPLARAGTAHAELTESADGWSLTLTLDDAVLDAVCAGGSVVRADVTVTVTPNLVPFEPFSITSVRVVRTEGADLTNEGEIA